MVDEISDSLLFTHHMNYDPVERVPESARSIQQRNFFDPDRSPMGSIFLYPVHLSNNIFGFRLLATSS